MKKKTRESGKDKNTDKSQMNLTVNIWKQFFVVVVFAIRVVIFCLSFSFALNWKDEEEKEKKNEREREREKKGKEAKYNKVNSHWFILVCSSVC